MTPEREDRNPWSEGGADETATRNETPSSYAEGVEQPRETAYSTTAPVGVAPSGRPPMDEAHGSAGNADANGPPGRVADESGFGSGALPADSASSSGGAQQDPGYGEATDARGQLQDPIEGSFGRTVGGPSIDQSGYGGGAPDIGHESGEERQTEKTEALPEQLAGAGSETQGASSGIVSRESVSTASEERSSTVPSRAESDRSSRAGEFGEGSHGHGTNEEGRGRI